MKRMLLFLCGACSCFLYTQDFKKALYGIRTNFEKEVYSTVQTHEQQRVLDALSLADHSVHDFIKFLEENSLQSSIQQALYISAALHMHARLKAESEFLVKTMYVLQLNNQYWQKELVCERAPLYKKSIDRWGYSFVYIKNIQARLKHLKTTQDMIALQLGKYRYLLHQFEMIQTIADIKKLFECIGQDKFFESVSAVSIVHPAIQSAYSFHECAKHVKKFCWEACSFTKIPSHIERNKLAYAATLLGALALYMVVTENVGCIKSTYEKVEKNVPLFVDNHIIGPSQEILRIFLNEDTAFRPNLENIKIDEAEELALINDLAIKLGVTVEAAKEEYRKILLDAGHVFRLLDPRESHLKNVARAAIFRVALLLLDLKKSINATAGVGQQMLDELHDILDQMKLVISVAALFPAALVSWAGYKSIVGLYELMFKKIFITQPFKETIRSIHTLLNEHIHLQEKEYRAEGYLYFYTQILHIIGEKLSLEQQEIFYEDVLLLQKYEYTYEQKFNIVQRMYATYDFLHQ